MKRLLVVDDEPDIREIIIMELNETFKCHEASGGEEALKIFKSIPIDFIITDMKMPYGSGAFLIKNLRKLGYPKPIIVASGFADPEKVSTLPGECLFLKKPFNFSELHFLIKKLQSSVLF